MRSTWTDERLDDFRADVDRRFDAVDRRFDAVDARFDRIEAKIDAQNTRIDGLQRTMVQLFAATMAAMVTGFLTLAGVIVTQV